MSSEERFKHSSPEIEAEIYYLTTEEGGRHTPVFNGYRGQFHYDGRDWDAAQEFLDKDICKLGETVKVYLQCSSPAFHQGKLFIGKTFETREGGRIVGKGKITNLLRADYEVWEMQDVVQILEKEGVFAQNDNILNDFFNKIQFRFRHIKGIQKVRMSKKKSSSLLLSMQIKSDPKIGVSPRDVSQAILSMWDQGNPAKHSMAKWMFENGRWTYYFIFWDKKYVSGSIQFPYA